MWSLSYLGETHPFTNVDVLSVEIDGSTYRVGDAEVPLGDGLIFGQDYAEPGDINLRLLVSFAERRNVLDARKRVREVTSWFSQLWDAEPLRRTAGEKAELSIPELGLFVGRPRLIEWDWSTYKLGYVFGKARFIRSDLGVYALAPDGTAPWFEARVEMIPPQTGGWVFPLTFPLVSAEPTVRATTFVVGGEAPTWPVLEINGPIATGAQLEITGSGYAWALRLSRRLAYDEVALIDTRPGQRATYVNGAPVNVLAPSGVPISDALMRPGPTQIALRGTSAEGTAHARVRWREMKAGI